MVSCLFFGGEKEFEVLLGWQVEVLERGGLRDPIEISWAGRYSPIMFSQNRVNGSQESIICITPQQAEVRSLGSTSG